MPRWDPDDYGRNAAAQTAWADELLPILSLTGDESVLDLGSGDGRITAAIAESIPQGRVVGLDASCAMVAHARLHYGRRHPNLDFVLGDMQTMPFRDAFDRVFSNAALHWARDLGSVVEGIARALRSGGTVLVQCGGSGNAAPIIRVLEDLIRSPEWAPFFSDRTFRYVFPDDVAFRALLIASKLDPIEVRLIPKTMVQAGRAGLEGWIRTTWLRYTESVPERERNAFINAVVDRYIETYPPSPDGTVKVPMVRLQAIAMRI
jgi:trans-aconitate methyltransferase